jgi:hypothetical protein
MYQSRRKEAIEAAPPSAVQLAKLGGALGARPVLARAP